MKTDSNSIFPEIYRKLETLSELIIERNTLIEILGEIQRKSATNILLHKFNSKIKLIDKQMSRVAASLSCSVCSEVLSLNDDVLACQWCGSPAHKDHLLHFVRKEGYCPACGEALKFHHKGTIKTITHDNFKAYLAHHTDKIHELRITFGDKPLEEVVAEDKLLCPSCRQRILRDWNFCRSCGARIARKAREEVQMIPCPRCGKEIKASWGYCKWCGQSIID